MYLYINTNMYKYTYIHVCVRDIQGIYVRTMCIYIYTFIYIYIDVAYLRCI